MNRAFIILPLFALGCPGSETGINNTIINGFVIIPPVTITEAEPVDDASSNNICATTTETVEVDYRIAVVNGTTATFGLLGSAADEDCYLFSLDVPATLSFGLIYDTLVSDKGVDDASLVFSLVGFDEKGNEVDMGSMDGQGYAGQMWLDLELEPGAYGVRVGGGSKPEKATSLAYQLVSAGFDPNETEFLVGAYMTDDVVNHGTPVGGATAHDFTLNPESYTWSGAYQVLYLRSVGLCADTDEACADAINNQDAVASGKEEDTAIKTNPVVNEVINSVYLFAGLFTDLNSAPASGTFYSATPVYVDTSANETIPGTINVVVDSFIPRIQGWIYEEVESNDVFIDGSNISAVDPKLLAESANVAPACSGVPYTDTISAVLTNSAPIDNWGQGDADIYAITTATEVGATFRTGWPDTSSDIDVLFYGPDGALYAYAAGITDPEVFNTVDFGFYLEPETTYYLAILGYVAPAGDTTYTVDIEYAAP